MGGRLDKTAYRYMLTRRRGLLGPKMGQGRVCTSETKGRFSITTGPRCLRAARDGRKTRLKTLRKRKNIEHLELISARRRSTIAALIPTVGLRELLFCLVPEQHIQQSHQLGLLLCSACVVGSLLGELREFMCQNALGCVLGKVYRVP